MRYTIRARSKNPDEAHKTLSGNIKEKRDYKKFLDLVYPRLDKGGVFTAHNVVNKKNEMTDFLDAIERNPAFWTAIVSPASEGISLSYKK